MESIWEKVDDAGKRAFASKNNWFRGKREAYYIFLVAGMVWGRRGKSSNTGKILSGLRALFFSRGESLYISKKKEKRVTPFSARGRTRDPPALRSHSGYRGGKREAA